MIYFIIMKYYWYYFIKTAKITYQFNKFNFIVFKEKIKVLLLIFNKSFNSPWWSKEFWHKYWSLLISYNFKKFHNENTNLFFSKTNKQVAFLSNDICFSTSQNFINLYLIYPISVISLPNWVIGISLKILYLIFGIIWRKYFKVMLT